MPPAELTFLEPFNKLFEVPTRPAEAIYPLPEAVQQDEIMPNLLNDRLFYLALFSIEHSRGIDFHYSLFLWEMFGTSPGCLLEFRQGIRAYDRVVQGRWSFQNTLSTLIEGSDIERPTTLESFLSLINRRLPTLSHIHSSKMRLLQLKDRLLELRQEFRIFGLGKDFYSDIILISKRKKQALTTSSDAAWTQSCQRDLFVPN